MHGRAVWRGGGMAPYGSFRRRGQTAWQNPPNLYTYSPIAHPIRPPALPSVRNEPTAPHHVSHPHPLHLSPRLTPANYIIWSSNRYSPTPSHRLPHQPPISTFADHFTLAKHSAARDRWPVQPSDGLQPVPVSALKSEAVQALRLAKAHGLKPVPVSEFQLEAVQALRLVLGAGVPTAASEGVPAAATSAAAPVLRVGPAVTRRPASSRRRSMCRNSVCTSVPQHRTGVCALARASQQFRPSERRGTAGRERCLTRVGWGAYTVRGRSLTRADVERRVQGDSHGQARRGQVRIGSQLTPHHLGGGEAQDRADPLASSHERVAHALMAGGCLGVVRPITRQHCKR